jgi:hypothetical protein
MYEFIKRGDGDGAVAPHQNLHEEIGRRGKGSTGMVAWKTLVISPSFLQDKFGVFHTTPIVGLPPSPQRQVNHRGDTRLREDLLNSLADHCFLLP